MKKALATLFVSALIAAGFVLVSSAWRKAPLDPWRERDPGLELPQSLPALASRAGDFTVLLVPHEPDPALRSKVDQALGRAMGLEPDPESVAFVRYVVSHEGAELRTFDPGLIRVRADGPTSLPLRRPAAVARADRTGIARLALATHDGDPAVPLAPGHLRTGLVLLPVGLEFEDLRSGEAEGQMLVRGQVATQRWIEWFERDAPSERWLDALFTPEAEQR